MEQLKHSEIIQLNDLNVVVACEDNLIIINIH